MRDIKNIFERVPFEDHEKSDVISSIIREANEEDLSGIDEREIVIDKNNQLLVRKKNEIIKIGGTTTIEKTIRSSSASTPSKEFSVATAVVYVAKYGSDDNSGLNINQPKLTISAALTIADGLITAGADKASVNILDADMYSEDLTINENVIVIGLAAGLEGAATLDAGSELHLDRHYATHNSDKLIDMVSNSGAHSHYSANVMDGRGIAGNKTSTILVKNGSSGRILFVKIGVGFVAESGVGIRDGSSSGFGHVHFFFHDLYLAGDSAIGLKTNNANTNLIGYIDHILEVDSPSSTIAINMIDASSIIKITVSEIIADEVWNITDGDLHIVCPKLTGTRTGDATIVIDSYAASVNTDTTNFDNNLSSADDTVQKALETLDELTTGGGGSLDFLLPDWLPNLRNWIKPDSLTNNVSSITVLSTWNDESSHINNYSPVNSPVKAFYKGHKVANFDGADQYFYTNGTYTKNVYFGADATGDYTWIGLFKADSDAFTKNRFLDTQYKTSSDSYNHTVQVRYNNGNGYFGVALRDTSGNLVSVDQIATTDIEDYIIVAWTYDNSTQTLTVYNNGSSYTDSDASIDMSTDVTDTPTIPAVLGLPYAASPNTSYCWKGDLVERILYTDVKSTDEINQLAQYLMNKYGDQTLWTDI